MQRALVLAAAIVLAAAAPARPTAVQITSGNTSLIFGGSDAEGGIGDWYVSNGVVEAIIDDVGVATDLSGLLPGSEPPIQSGASPTGGTIVDLGLVGQDNDQLSQMFTVGGLSTSNFVLYDSVSAPSSDTIRATGKLLLPPISVAPSPCVDIVTDHTASGTDPFLTVTTTATNNCGVDLTGFNGFLDAFIWTQRSIIPFAAGAPPIGGRGFNHAVLDLSNPAGALELPTFLAGPGAVGPADGVFDTATATSSGEVSYGLIGVQTVADTDGPGPNLPVTTPINGLFGINSTLVSALGNFPIALPPPGALEPGGTFEYSRRLYVGDRNDARSVADPMFAELAVRTGFSTGTISGDVDAADTAAVSATVLITRVGRCQGNPSISCLAAATCTGGTGPCNDPVPTAGFGVGGAASQVRTDANGLFSAVLPAGDYQLLVASPERGDVTVQPVVVTASTNTPVSVPALSARGAFTFTVREKRKGLPLTSAKLTFKGVSPTPDPRFNKDVSALIGTSDILPETFGGTQAGTAGSAVGQSNVVYTATGSGTIELRPGTYDVYASRGTEYSIQLKRVTVPGAGSVSADFLVKRAVKTKNAVSADFHVHSGRSFDTNAPPRDRVLAFAAEGVEVMVSTDHDKHFDYAPIISSFALGSTLRSIVGNEVTGSVPNPPVLPQSFGHINAWPVSVQPDERRDGAIQDEYVAPNWLYKRLRDQGAQVIQYNHPRAGVSGLTSIGFFNNFGCGRCANDIDTTCVVDTDCPAAPAPRDCTCVGYQPDRPITMAPNDFLLDDGVVGPGSPQNPALDPDTGDNIRNIDFDVVEVLNGAKDSDFPSLRMVRRDWLSLLNQGIYRPGTAVSDSHRITIEHAGWARSFVQGVGDDPAALDLNLFNANVKAGAMVMSAGPYIKFELKPTSGPKAGIGGTLVSPPGGQVKLDITVSSPAWMPVSEVRIIKNGFVIATYNANTIPRVVPTPVDFQRTGSTRRFRGRITMPVATDSYFVVEAGPTLPANVNTLPAVPPIVDIVAPDVVPVAITNPIFVDLAGDGFDPPGLPVMMAGDPSPAAVLADTPPVGFWKQAWQEMVRLASRWTAEVVAQENPGEMTGVTREQKEEAARKGEYFPLHDFAIPPEAVEAIRKQQEQAGQAAPATEDAGQQ